MTGVKAERPWEEEGNSYIQDLKKRTSSSALRATETAASSSPPTVTGAATNPGTTRVKGTTSRQQGRWSKSGSVFATENCTVVVAQIGGTATLPCVVKKFNTAVVSWIRKNDLHLLTVGLSTYNSDDRFMVEHVRHLQNWGLLIKHVQPSDAGFYECQVSTHPSTSILLELRVTEATAEILGAPDLHLKAGSLLRLVCTFRQSTEPPAYVFWYHEQRMINYDEGVKVTMDRTSSVLLVPETDKSHNGNYTCSPSNVVPSSINVHVLNSTVEEKPAAMQHANTSSKSPSSQQMFLINCGTVLFVILTVHKTT
ncbi:Immunoglobulin V-set domain [Popillia japonica]|uniref:Immunoglobulin V-set domain n=1 Tax=Popillia japonica TaxID=7064 RepID=A0AAW1IVN9_POPJA